MTSNQSRQKPVELPPVRQTLRGITLRTRMLIAFALLAILPPLFIGSTAAWISARGLRDNAFHALNSVAVLKYNAIHEWLQVLQTNLPLAFENQGVRQGVSTMLMNDEEYVINQTQLRRQLSAFKDKTGYFIEIFVLDRDGRVVLSTDGAQEGKIHKTQDFFHNGLTGQFVSPPIYEVSLNSYSITFAEPIQTSNGTVIGVLAGRANISRLSEIMEQETGLGEFGETYLVSPNFAALTTLRNTNFELGKTYVRTQGVVEALKSKTDGSAEYVDYAGNNTLGVYKWVPELQIALIAEHQERDALTASGRVLQVSMTVIFVGVILSLVVAILFIRTITGPIGNLVNVASNIIGQGNFEVRADVVRNDEIGLLAQAFNTMIGQLQEFIGKLEQRVQERTQALASVAEISTAASTVRETDRLLQQVVDLAKERFGFYHAHIYLLNEAGDALVLSSGAGEVGRQMVANGHSIPLDREQSLVARAAREKKGVTVNDVTQTPDFLPNPLLPDTRSEMAVPMMVGDKVIGVFDVQSETVGRFTDADIAVQTTLAAQVANAVQNARLFDQTQAALASVQKSESALNEAMAIAGMANWELDLETLRFIFNDHLYQMLGTTAEEQGGYELSAEEYIRKFIHPEDAELIAGEIQASLQAPDPQNYKASVEFRLIRKDGQILYMSSDYRLRVNKQGRAVRGIGSFLDITERKLLENQLAHRARQQEAINLITRKIQSAITVEDALQVAAREVGHVLGGRETIVSLEPPALAMNDSKN